MKSHINTYLKYIQYQKRYSAHTIKAYKNDLRSFADHIDLSFGISDPKLIDNKLISSFIAELVESGISTKSVNRKISAVQSFFQYLQNEGELDQNSVKSITRPKQAKRLPTVLRLEQTENLFNQIKFPDDFEGSRDKAILTMFYTCGIRREELINLRLTDVDLQNESIKVVGKRNKERIIPISEKLTSVLKQYFVTREKKKNSCNNFFITNKGEKLYPSLVYKIVKFYLSQVTTVGKKSPHVLRHTFATHLLNEGANLQSIKELLGHASLAATQVYTQTSLEHLKDVYNKSHPRNKK